MRVLIGTDTYVPSVNGVVTSTLNLKAGLTELGHDVRIITLSNTLESYYDDGVYYIGSLDVGRVYPDARFKIRTSKNEVDDILDWAPDIIHTQSEFSILPITAKVSRKLKTPHVHTYHTMYEDYTHYFSPSKTVGKKVVMTLTNIFSDYVDGMIAPAQKTFDLLSNYGVGCPLKCIPSGISLEKFAEPTNFEYLSELKASLNIPKQNLVCLSVSRVGKEKNISELIENIKNIDNISLVIVGDGPYKQELEQLVQTLNIGHKVVFTGMIAPTEVINYYKMADLFVSASKSETQGLTYVEALACGTPLLCRNDDCLNGVLIEGENGYGFENESEFHEKLNLFISRDDKDKMADCAKKIAQKFSKLNFAKNVAEFYQELINAKTQVSEENELKRRWLDNVI